MFTVDSSELGKEERVSDAAGRYFEFCKGSIPPIMEFRGFKIVVDCAHGATYHVAPKVFDELGSEVIAIGVEPDGLNINHDIGSTHPQATQMAVLEHGADLGIAFDGDGDREIMVDHKGEVVDGDESSGHLFCLDRTTTGDGIVAALQVVAEIVRSGRTLHELKMGMSKFPQCMVNVRVTPGFDLRGAEVVQRAYQALVAELIDSGRVWLRASGTEPLIRVMVEGVDAEQVRFQAQRLARVVAEAASIAS